jgi:hypothetical protein
VDAGGAVDVLAARAADAADTSAVEALVRRLWNVSRRSRRPSRDCPRWRSRCCRYAPSARTGDFEDQGGNVDALVDPVTRRRRTGQEQGPWLSEIVDRDLNAVLASWGNPMDIVDEQELPAGSVVLRGLAAPMRGRGRWDGVRDVPVEVRPGGGAQIYHAGQCVDGLPVQALPAPRRAVNAYTIGPRGVADGGRCEVPILSALTLAVASEQTSATTSGTSRAPATARMPAPVTISSPLPADSLLFESMTHGGPE